MEWCLNFSSHTENEAISSQLAANLLFVILCTYRLESTYFHGFWWLIHSYYSRKWSKVINIRMTDKNLPVKIISYGETSKSVFWFWFWGWEMYFDASQDAAWCFSAFIQPTDCFKFSSVELIISGLGVPMMPQVTFVKPILWKKRAVVPLSF